MQFYKFPLLRGSNISLFIVFPAPFSVLLSKILFYGRQLVLRKAEVDWLGFGMPAIMQAMQAGRPASAHL